jgi:ribosomal protein S18 acetylase RimI-like enzyme
LRPITAQELQGWLAEHHRGYVASRIAAGEPALIAEANGATSLVKFFPKGEPAKGHSVFMLVEGEDHAAEGVVVGSLWVGPYPDDRIDGIWVWSVAVDEEHRGRGLGRAAMLLAEDEARRCGATEVGLNVFGFNDVARGLYHSLGYEAVSVQMRKVLS